MPTLPERIEQVYLDFVRNRHSVWNARQAGLPAPWTSDPIVATRKFTNVYRVLDHGSQFLFDGMLEGDPTDVLMRCFLYRHTGRTEAWEFAEVMLGRWPVLDDLADGGLLRLFKEYRGATSTKVVKTRWAGVPTDRLVAKRQVFTNAYLVFPQTHDKGSDKLESILSLTERVFVDSGDFARDFLAMEGDPAARFALLRGQRGVGDFMAMQILTDWGYSSHGADHDENAFVVAGPGSRRGAQAVFPHQRPETTIAWGRETLDMLGYSLPIGRAPSLMDVQNTLCEFSKYVRYLGKPTPAKPYEPAHPGPQPTPVYPLHWV